MVFRAHGKRGDRDASESGNAIVEFLGVLVVLVVPALLLIASLATVTAAQFAANAAARDSARAFVRAESSSTAAGIGRAAAERAVSDRGRIGEHTVSFSCSATPCLSAGSDVTATVSIRAVLPVIGTTVTISDSATMTVDPYRRSR